MTVAMPRLPPAPGSCCGRLLASLRAAPTGRGKGERPGAGTSATRRRPSRNWTLGVLCQPRVSPPPGMIHSTPAAAREPELGVTVAAGCRHGEIRRKTELAELSSFLKTRTDTGEPDPRRGRVGTSVGANWIPDLLLQPADGGASTRAVSLYWDLPVVVPRPSAGSVFSLTKSGVEDNSPPSSPPSLPPLTFVRLSLVFFPKRAKANMDTSEQVRIQQNVCVCM